MRSRSWKEIRAVVWCEVRRTTNYVTWGTRRQRFPRFGGIRFNTEMSRDDDSSGWQLTESDPGVFTYVFIISVVSCLELD